MKKLLSKLKGEIEIHVRHENVYLVSVDTDIYLNNPVIVMKKIGHTYSKENVYRVHDLKRYADKLPDNNYEIEFEDDNKMIIHKSKSVKYTVPVVEVNDHISIPDYGTYNNIGYNINIHEMHSRLKPIFKSFSKYDKEYLQCIRIEPERYMATDVRQLHIQKVPDLVSETVSIHSKVVELMLTDSKTAHILKLSDDKILITSGNLMVFYEDMHTGMYPDVDSIIPINGFTFEHKINNKEWMNAIKDIITDNDDGIDRAYIKSINNQIHLKNKISDITVTEAVQNNIDCPVDYKRLLNCINMFDSDCTMKYIHSKYPRPIVFEDDNAIHLLMPLVK